MTGNGHGGGLYDMVTGFGCGIGNGSDGNGFGEGGRTRLDYEHGDGRIGGGYGGYAEGGGYGIGNGNPPTVDQYEHDEDFRLTCASALAVHQLISTKENEK